MTTNPLESTQDSRSFEIAKLIDQHLPEAAELFAAGYRVLRRRVPSMPPRHENPDSILPKLQGIAAALLSHVLDWARSRDYERCAVGFEPQNIPGARLWLKHFRPVNYSMIRHIDERIASADIGLEKGLSGSDALCRRGTASGEEGNMMDADANGQVS